MKIFLLFRNRNVWTFSFFFYFKMCFFIQRNVLITFTNEQPLKRKGKGRRKIQRNETEKFRAKE